MCCAPRLATRWWSGCPPPPTRASSSPSSWEPTRGSTGHRGSPSSAARSPRRSSPRWTRSASSPSARIPTQTEAHRGQVPPRGQPAPAPGGIFSLALSAIDIACWDLKGKAVGQSVCALLGGLRDRAPTYASGALMRPHPIEYLAKAGPRLVEMGFRQMKMQCGSEATVAESIERVRVMREAIGPDVDLMCDINQLWSVNQAIEIGQPHRAVPASSGSRTRPPTTTSRDWPGSPTPSSRPSPPASTTTASCRSATCWSTVPSTS